MGDKRVKDLTYGDGFLWVGIDRINKFDPTNGAYLEDLEIPANAAKLYINGKFYAYDQNDNTLKVWYLNPVSVNEQNIVTVPEHFSLSQNYPNPFNPSTTIGFNLPKSSHVNISVFNVLGEKVMDIVNEFMNAGSHQKNIDMEKFSSGVYLYKIQSGDFVQTRKMTLLK